MRKLFMFNMISIDGFFARENGDIDWHVTDDDFNAFAIEFNKNVDTVLFGRTTYQLFESFWPIALKAPETSPEDRIIAQIIEDAEKHVFSTTLESVSWNNSFLHNDIDPAFIQQLKEKEGGDIVIWGSGTVCSQLAKAKLIDEYVFMINPVILGKGKSLFDEIASDINLERINLKEYKSGNILVTYQPKDHV